MKLSEDMKVKATLAIFVVSIVRLFFFFDSPDAVGDFKRDKFNMIQDSVSIYEYIVTKPINKTPPAEVTAVEKNDLLETMPPATEEELSSEEQRVAIDIGTAPVDIEEESQDVEPSSITKATPTVDSVAITDSIEPPDIDLPSEVKTTVTPAFRKKFKSLLSCKSYQGSSDIHPMIWKLMVKKSGQKKYITREPTALPVISKEIFGGEECWAKLWSLNPEISNPFDIPKSTAIFLYEK